MLDKVGEPGSSKATFYELLGGVEKVRELVERFYDIMDTDPKATGWTGGPQLYIERYGHPFLRARHLPFTIGESERDQWMYCMIRAMHDIGVEEPVMVQLGNALWGVADFMRNQAGEGK